MQRPSGPASWSAGIVAAWAVAAVVAASSAGSDRDGSGENGVTGRVETAWKRGEAVPIAVQAGRADFQVPTASPGSKTLVVVSALSRGAGPFPISIRAEATPRPLILPKSVEEAAAPRRAPPPAPPASPPSARPSTDRPQEYRTFSVLARAGDPAAADSYDQVRARLRAVGHRIQVYVDVADELVVKPETLRDLVATFDDRIFASISPSLGTAHDVDGDGRFTVFMTGALARLDGGKLAADGFVRPADFDAEVPHPYGNRCDMMYLSASAATGPHLRTVLAHEYTHAVTSSQKARAGVANGQGLAEEEDWLDEAIAHLAEDRLDFSKSNLDYRVSAFLSNPERYSLVVADYFAAGLFRSHGHRGGTYLFLRWCADQAGPSLLPALVRSGRRGVRNLEAATGESFPSLYRRWSVALFLSGMEAEGTRTSGTPPLRGPFDDWVLAGPRAVEVEPGGKVDAWSAAGTTSHFAVVAGSASGGVRVRVEGPEGADLQVTAVRLPEDLPRVALTIQSDATRDGFPAFRAHLSERDGSPVRMEALAWEPLVPATDPRTATFRRDGLDALGIASAFGSSTLPGRGRLDSRAIRLGGGEGAGSPLIFKAVGADSRGRRVSGWALVEPALDRH